MSNENVNSIFKPILDSISGGENYKVSIPDPYEEDGKIPTSDGLKTIPEIMDNLMWCSYRANRGYGSSSELLIKNGIGNIAMEERYQRELLNQNQQP